MKKQTRIVIGILFAVVIIIIVLSINFPPVFKGKSSGTFAKSDKYHKSQMSGKDVQLRSELTSDTAKLKSTLQGMKCGDDGYSQLMQLKDYAVFIRNNNETLGKTIALLASFYLSDVPDQSADVEKNLREFSDYVKLFTEKDEVLESALKGMDTYILGNKILQERKDELKKLKSIRDQILISGV